MTSVRFKPANQKPPESRQHYTAIDLGACRASRTESSHPNASGRHHDCANRCAPLALGLKRLNGARPARDEQQPANASACDPLHHRRHRALGKIAQHRARQEPRWLRTDLLEPKWPMQGPVALGVFIFSYGRSSRPRRSLCSQTVQSSILLRLSKLRSPRSRQVPKKP